MLHGRSRPLGYIAGFRIGPVWERVAVDNADAQKADSQLEASFAALHADLKLGQASIVCMRFDDRPNTTEHFRLVLGYDAATDEVIFHDPAIEQGRTWRKRPSFSAFGR